MVLRALYSRIFCSLVLIRWLLLSRTACWISKSVVEEKYVP